MAFIKDESGQGMVEYVLVLAVIALVAVVALVALGPKTGQIFNKANDKL